MNGNFGFCKITFLVLLVLKLAGLSDIAWGWVWVPLIVGVILALLEEWWELHNR